MHHHPTATRRPAAAVAAAAAAAVAVVTSLFGSASADASTFQWKESYITYWNDPVGWLRTDGTTPAPPGAGDIANFTWQSTVYFGGDAAALVVNVRDRAWFDPDAGANPTLALTNGIVITDSGVHSTLWVHEWPRSDSPVGFLSPVVFARHPNTGEAITHILSIVLTPVPVAKALKRIRDEKKVWRGNEKLRAIDTKGLGEKVGAAADAVTTFVNSPEAKQTFINLNSALNELRVVLARIDGNVGPVSDDLKKTLAEAQTALKSLEATSQTTQRFVAAQGNVGEDVTNALHQLSDAAAALERLADTLTRNPSSLLVGKKKPEPATKR